MNKFILLLFCIFQLPAIAKPLNVTLVIPAILPQPFWSQLAGISKKAASDLNINLTVIGIKKDTTAHMARLEQIKWITKQNNKPDYVVFMPQTDTALQSFNLLEQKKIKFVTFGRTHVDYAHLALGRPREKYKYWIGESFYNNEQAGRLLADYLITKAKDSKKKITSATR